MSYDEIAWFPLCLTLSLLGAVAAVLVTRRRGVVPGARLLAWAMLPMALYLIGAVALVWRIGTAITRFVTGFAFSPKTWSGVVLLVVAVVLFAVTGALRRRGIGTRTTPGAKAEVTGATAAVPGGKAPTARRPVGAAKAPAKKSDDLSGFEDVEEILRRRGIG
jgi:hypothetical protein